MELPNGVTFEEFEDGSITLTAKNGTQVSIDADGNVSANLSKIRNIGIRNLVDIESHTINDVFGSRSHVIKFKDGGIAKFSYNQIGQLIELGGNQLGLSLTPEGDVIFSSKKSQ